MFLDSMKKLLLTVILIQLIIGTASSFFALSQALAADDQKGPLFTDRQSIQVLGNRISIDVRDAGINDVLREIAQKAHIDISSGDGIAGKVTMQLTEVTIEEALEYLCRSRALVYEYQPDKKTYRIIRAVAFTETNEKGGSKSGASPGDGSQSGQVLSEAFPDQASAQPDIRTLQKDVGFEADHPSRPNYKSGELLVKFKQDVTGRQIADLHRSLGSTVLGSIINLRLERIKLREGLSEEAAMELYRAVDIVEHVEKHALRYPNMTPNDPDFSRQWGLTKIKAREAWDITRGNPEVIVAVIDTGVDYRHPDLKDNIWTNTTELNGMPGEDDDGDGYIDDVRGWDFVGNDTNNPQADADPMDVYGHGTHLAGIIAAGGNNGLGIAGINWQVKIMALKVQADYEPYFEDFAIIQAIQYAIAKGAKIINCSFGGGARSDNEENAFIALKNAGILAVCAAGNDGWNTDLAGQENYPSGYNLENIISVAASDENDNLATFSNYGLTSVDVMAPGVNIYSTVPEGSDTDARIRIAGAGPVEYAAIGMLFAGRTDANGITGTAYDCGMGYPDQFPAGVSGYIAIIERGHSPSLPPFTFSDKVRNAQNAGAAGVIIYNNNNTVDDLDLHGGTLGSAGNPLWVPVVSITKANGEALKARIALGNPLVTLINKPVVSPYNTKSGTSMAGPHVAGLAALMLARCPAQSYGEIKSAILNTADKIPAAMGKMVSEGRINAFAALTSLLPIQAGDLSGDCRIGLEDAILALQILSGLTPPIPYPCPSCGNDVNGDDAIGLEEAIFILQKAAGIR